MSPGASRQADSWDVTSAKTRLERMCGKVQLEWGLQDATGAAAGLAAMQEQGSGLQGGLGPEVHRESGFMPGWSQCCPQTRHRPFHKLHSLGCSMETQARTGDGGQAASLLPVWGGCP